MVPMMKIIAIIQARMSSTRLPGKVLADISGMSMIDRIVQRVAAVSAIQKCVVATTTDLADDVLVEHLQRRSVCVFRGARDDVLDRYYQCAAQHSANIIVRVTADDPFKDPGIVEQAVNLFLADPVIDYCSNTLVPTYPEGLDVEVFRYSALARAWKQAAQPSEREHVTPYIWKRPDLFRLTSFEFERDLSSWRWTVDRPVDLEFARTVFAHFSISPLVPFAEILAWLEANPAVRAINAGIERNEGYLKSLASEQQ